MEVQYDKEKDILTLDGQPYSGSFVKLVLDPLIIGVTYKTVKLPDSVTSARVIVNPVGVWRVWKLAQALDWWFLLLSFPAMIWLSQTVGLFFLTASVIYGAARLVITAIGEASDNIISEIISHK